MLAIAFYQSQNNRLTGRYREQAHSYRSDVDCNAAFQIKYGAHKKPGLKAGLFVTAANGAD
ncbi:hypothetical protein AUC60_21605 [Pseudomonas caspiana]|uniref:Uncharacterized protein n=1 Tax=Pseudomonas caspiana TaxID=1451454 RepID=A0A1Y3NVW3_9PSED|nr:hypothetical protein AUC60_21605 [Pseudomonas caspiana]